MRNEAVMNLSPVFSHLSPPSKIRLYVHLVFHTFYLHSSGLIPPLLSFLSSFSSTLLVVLLSVLHEQKENKNTQTSLSSLLLCSFFR